MNRKEFIKNSVKTGTCACAAMLLGGKGFASAGGPQTQQENKNQEFIRGWTENLMLIMDKALDEETRAKIMEESGRKCADKSFIPMALKYKGKVEDLLDLMKKEWAETVEYDKKKGVIRIVGKKSAGCICPLVKGRAKLASETFCLCSRGWYKCVFETVTGKKAQVELEKTVLRGGDCCTYKISLA